MHLEQIRVQKDFQHEMAQAKIESVKSAKRTAVELEEKALAAALVEGKEKSEYIARV